MIKFGRSKVFTVGRAGVKGSFRESVNKISKRLPKELSEGMVDSVLFNDLFMESYVELYGLKEIRVQYLGGVVSNGD